MTPLVLLVGFLGAGKTTYLKELLPALVPRGLDPHVVINDYENARVDAQQLAGLAESIVPISGSCVCCGSREELAAALENFEHRPGRVLIIETNGTTDAEELIEMLSLDPALRQFSLPIQVSLVDAKRWQKRFWHNSLEREQVRTANYLHLSRADEVGANRLAQVEQSLQALVAAPGRLDPEAFSLELAQISAEISDLPDREAHVHSEQCGCVHHGEEEHSHVHARGAHHFASLQIGLPPLVPLAALKRFLRELPEEVIRAKGLVRLEESPDEYHVFQKIDGIEEAQLLPIGNSSRLTEPVAVFIGPQIPEQRILDAVAELANAAVSRASTRG